MLWVLADNPRARRFYEREDWKAEGTRHDTVRGVEVEEALYRLVLDRLGLIRARAFRLQHRPWP